MNDETSTPKSSRGGPRPNAGAKPGNLNALKHGRYSRFRNALPYPGISAFQVARRLYKRDQRALARVAESAMRLAVLAAHQRELADAVAVGAPIPPPPAIACSVDDIERVRDFMEGEALRARLADAYARGSVPADAPALEDARRFADAVDQVFPTLVMLLDSAARPALPPATLAEAFRPPQNEQRNRQSPSAWLESADTLIVALSESIVPRKKKNDSSKPNPRPDPLEPHPNDETV